MCNNMNWLLFQDDGVSGAPYENVKRNKNLSLAEVDGGLRALGI